MKTNMRSLVLLTLAAALVLLAGCRGTGQPPSQVPVDSPPPVGDEAAAPAFQAGTWLAQSGDTGTYYFFDPDGTSGRTASQETGTGLGFTYTVQDGRGTFSMGGAGNTSACTLKKTDAEHITIQWENGREEVLTYISAEGSEEFRFYSNDSLCELAIRHYSRTAGADKQLTAAAATNEDGTVTVQLYENLGGHNSTAAWYTVDRQTGKGTDANTGEEVDLGALEEGLSPQAASK